MARSPSASKKKTKDYPCHDYFTVVYYFCATLDVAARKG
jgi:hypothetical protein